MHVLIVSSLCILLSYAFNTTSFFDNKLLKKMNPSVAVMRTWFENCNTLTHIYVYAYEHACSARKLIKELQEQHDHDRGINCRLYITRRYPLS
eukprot:m.75856 g.75856  ORF g.75856 m.75856 type:complete len:93 (-) comp8498_c1_seq2:1828-2106(-)